ncbi:MAG: hypothetical protein QXL22_03930 [Candidatus Nezhaarchaeales archaeon]
MINTLNLELINFIINKFSLFREKIDKFSKECDCIAGTVLAGLDEILLKSHFENGCDKSILSTRSDKLLSDFLKNLNEIAIEMYREYEKSYNNLIDDIENFSLKICGYLSIALSFEKLRNFWSEENRNVYMRFDNVNIGDQKIQSKFCEFISKGIDFFNGDYSFFEILKLHEEFSVDDEILRELYIGCYEDEKEKALNTFLNNLCRKPNLKNKGREIYQFLKQFFNCLWKASENRPIKEYEFIDIYNKFIVKNAIMEYELFRVVVSNGYLCLPKVRIYVKEDNGCIPLGEVDLLLLHNDTLHLVESTLRRDLCEKEEKLCRIIGYLKETGEIGEPRYHILDNKDKFEEFVKSLKNGESTYLFYLLNNKKFDI